MPEAAKVLEFQLKYHSFQRNPRADLLQKGLVGSPCSPRDSQESSPTPQIKSINSSVLSFLSSPTLTSNMTTGKTIALGRRTFVGKVMSLLFNMPVFLPGKSHGWRSLVGCSPWGHEESDMTERLHFHFSLSCIGECNGNPLQYSCLENPRDGSLVGCHLWGRTESDMTDVT